MRPGIWLLIAAMTIVGLVIFVVVRPAIQQRVTPPAEPRMSDPAASIRAPRAGGAPVKAAPPPGVVPDAPRPPEIGSPPERRPPAHAPALDSAPAATDESGSEETGNEPTGIAVFPPPGTKPVKRGIIVPDDVELPPGYVRHYQTTDDGHQLPPILMFHPDYRPVDEAGEPIPLPEDRIVPPEMAPAGIPAEVLDVPEEGAAADLGVSGHGRKRRDP